MQYYLRINDNASGPYWIEDVKRLLADEQVTLNTMARREGAQVWKLLGQILEEVELATPISPQPREHKPSPNGFKRKDVRSHLNFIRIYTNYPTLRKIINLFFGLSLIGVIVGLLGQFGMLLLATRSMGLSGFIFLFLILGVAVISALGLIAARLFLLMLVDLVDTLLHEHARNKHRE
jgi:hypothetical protein